MLFVRCTCVHGRAFTSVMTIFDFMMVRDVAFAACTRISTLLTVYIRRMLFTLVVVCARVSA